MAYSFFTLDVFTDRLFGGNPLAVVLDADDLSAQTMQAVAREFNLSETVFVIAPSDPSNTARLRIFTPVRELPFAGHPTVGTAVLLGQLANNDAPLILEEGVGPVTVQLKSVEGPAPYAQFQSQVLPFEEPSAPDNDLLAKALGLTPEEIGFGDFTTGFFNAGNKFLFVPVKSRDALKKAVPNTALWPQVLAGERFGVYVYCASEGDEVDFRGRMFARHASVIEDPATGSAIAAFPGAIHKAQKSVDGAYNWNMAQGEDMGRPSLIRFGANVSNDKIMSVYVGGNAVRVSRGELDI